MSRFITWIPVCPEVGCGMPVPREAMRLVNQSGQIRLSTIHTLQDQTDRVEAWTEPVLDELESIQCSGFVFKNRSPSCGPCHVKVFKSGAGAPSKSGIGIFARLFIQRFPHLPVEIEENLHHLERRESFIERVCVWRRWSDFLTSSAGEGLAYFHACHELLVMAHSPRLVKKIGELAASAGTDETGSVPQNYIALLMEGLKTTSTRSRQAAAFKHAAGYLKRWLDETERMELNHLIEQFRLGCVPFEVPVTQIMRHARRFGETHIENQVYFNPHPVEQMLRAHV